MNSGSLRLRLLSVAALSIFIALVVAGAALTRLFERHIERHAEQELDNHLRQILARIESDTDNKLFVPTALSDPRFELPFGGLYWQIQEGEEIVATSPSLGDETLSLPAPLPTTSGSSPKMIQGPLGQSLHIIVRESTIKFGDVEHQLRLAAAVDQADIAQSVQEFRQALLPSLGALGLCLWTAAWVQVAIGLRPLERLRRLLLPVRAGQQSQLDGQFPAEVMPLVDDLNALLRAQAGTIERARSRAGELAHGLKTPLTALNSISRDLSVRNEERAAGEIHSLVARMQAHVGRELSRTQIAYRRDRPAITHLRDTVEQLVAALRRAPRGDEVRWNIAIASDALIEMDHEDLSELLGNLLENALKWTASRIDVSATCTTPIWIRVEDDGPGVPEAKLAMIRQRGARLDPSSESTGLGLAIVSDITDAYGLTLELGPSALGGLAVKLLLREATVSATK